MSGETVTFEVTDSGIKADFKGFRDGVCLQDMDKILKELESMGVRATVENQKIKPEGFVHAKRNKTAVRR